MLLPPYKKGYSLLFGTLDSYVGLSPFERASGIDGISVNSLGQSVFFDVTINQVVLER